MAERRAEGGIAVGGGVLAPADERGVGVAPRASRARIAGRRWSGWGRWGGWGGWGGWAVVAGGWLAVRVALWASGTRFSTAAFGFPSQWQLLDATWLERHPLGPLWDLHTQPPLFNTFVGAVLAWSPLPDALSFQLLYAGLSLLAAVVLYRLLVAFGARPIVAALGTVVAFADPVLVGYEQVVHYECLITVLVLSTTWACHRYATSPTLGRLGLFLGLATTLVLTRALFHSLWLVGAAALVMVSRPPRAPWRRSALVAAVPLLLVAGLMTKNQVRFGTFSLSSWFGMNLERTIVDSLNPYEKDELIAEGTLSPQTRVTNFSAYDAYRPYVDECRADHGSAALDAPEKLDGTPNYNYACYLPIYEQAQHDAVAAARALPSRYLKSIRAAFVTYLSDQPTQEAEPSGATRLLDAVHDVLALEVPLDAPYPSGDNPEEVHVTALVALLGLMAAGGVGARRAWRGRRSSDDEASREDRTSGEDEPSGGDEPSSEDVQSSRNVTLAFVGFTLLFATVAGSMFELWENARFRLPLDPLLFGAAFAAVAETALRTFRRAPASQ